MFLPDQHGGETLLENHPSLPARSLVMPGWRVALALDTFSLGGCMLVGVRRAYPVPPSSVMKEP